MSTSIADERRLLAADEYEPIARSHYPSLASLQREELLDLVRWLRDQRGRFKGQIRRRVRRAKADVRNEATEKPASERGFAAKKQVFARALKRVNNQLDRVLAADKRAAMLAGMQAALERKRRAPRHHPSSGRRARGGVQPIENPKGDDIVQPSTIGSISQAGRVAQARRDNKPEA
jgi:hypothetical protein